MSMTKQGHEKHICVCKCTTLTQIKNQKKDIRSNPSEGVARHNIITVDNSRKGWLGLVPAG